MVENKKKIGWLVLGLIVLVAAAFLAGSYFNVFSIFGHSRHTAEEVVDVTTREDGVVEITQEHVPYVLEVEFGSTLLQEAQHEKKLIIMTRKASVPVVAEKEGLWSLPVFKQTKAVIYHGEGTFFVDLATLSNEDFIIDNQEKTITIYIPRPQFEVKYLPDETEFLNTSNGMLSFGEMKLTQEATTKLELQGIDRLTETLEKDASTWESAERFAKLSVKELYEPLIKAQIDAAVQDAKDEFAIPPQYTITVEIKD